jgi:hypothetical protein
MHFFRVPLVVIKSAEHSTSQAALQTTLDLSECAGRQRHDCGSEYPFAQQEPSHFCDPIVTPGDATAYARDIRTARFDIHAADGPVVLPNP